MNHLTELAAFVASADPPAEVIAKTALVLADSVGAIVGGAAEAEVRALTERLAPQSTGSAPIIGRDLTAAPLVAALLNGTAGTTLEMDEGNQFCKGHPGMHVIPAVLGTAAEDAAAGRAVTGDALLCAITLGYEVAARVGIATTLRPSMHPHGTWGAIGAAAGVLRLRARPATEIREAMNMAASLGLTTSRRTMLEGGTVRNAFAGVANQMGCLVADMVAAGYCGDREGVAHVFGHVASDSFAPAALTDQLGSRWEVSRNYFKMHACCRYNHAALDALATLTQEVPGLAPQDIEAIAVDSYAFAAELDDPEPGNVLAAKFSVPFAIATTLVNGSSAVESFAADKVNDPAIRSLAARVTIREDPAMTARLPDQRPARVELALKDGRTLSAATETNRGDWADPYAAEEIREKYLSLTARLWPRDKTEAMWTDLISLAEHGDAGAVLTRLGGPRV